MKLSAITGLFLFLTCCFTHAQHGNDLAYFCPPCNSACDAIAHNVPGRCEHCDMKLELTSTKARKTAIDNKTKKRMTIVFYLQDGVEILDFAGPMEVFTFAGFDVFTVSNKNPLTSQGILKIIPDYSMENAPKADILAFFGGNSSEASNDPKVIEWAQKQTPKYYFSVCTGAFVLAKMGILDGLTITTFHNSIDALKKAAPKSNVLANVRFVDNGHIITTAGISAGIDGALHLVSKIKGMEVAKEVVYYMEYDKWIPKEGLIIEAK